jgi:hypothetical protein
MEKLLEIIFKIIKLPLCLIVLAAIISGLLLFMPEKMLSTLKLTDFVKDFGKYLGFSFILSGGYVVISSLLGVAKMTSSFFHKKQSEKNTLETLYNLTYNDKVLLREFFYKEKM